MDKKVISFFRRSISTVVVICVAVFILLTLFMSHRTEILLFWDFTEKMVILRLFMEMK